MRKFLKSIFINGITIVLVASIFRGFSYGNDVKILLFSALALTLINYFLKPIIKIFLLPINLLTLGMFRWLTGVICIFFLTIIITEIQINSFQFTGFTYWGFVIPRFYFSTLLSLITASFLISLVTSFFNWLLKN